MKARGQFSKELSTVRLYSKASDSCRNISSSQTDGEIEIVHLLFKEFAALSKNILKLQSYLWQVLSVSVHPGQILSLFGS